MRTLVFLALLSLAPPQAPELVNLSPVLLLDGEVNDSSVEPLITFFNQAAKDHTPTAVLEIESGGGSVSAGYTLVEAMQNARTAGVHITCITSHAASMAATIFEAGCDTRRMRVRGNLMFHEAAYTLLLSTPGERLTRTHLLELAANVGADDDKIAKWVAPRLGMTPADFLAWIAGEDRYVMASEALAKGYVDELVP
jgi:ATP-dependent protease ClpP protease subunit